MPHPLKTWHTKITLANGPGASSEIDLNHLEAMQAPLLDHRTIAMNQEALQSTRSLTPSLPANGPQRSSFSQSTLRLDRPPESVTHGSSPVHHQRQLEWQFASQSAESFSVTWTTSCNEPVSIPTSATFETE
jgi:hypothetical protein